MEQGYYSSPRRKKKRGLPEYKKTKPMKPVLVKCEILNNVSPEETDIKFNLEEHKLVVEPRTLKLKWPDDARFPWEEEENV